MGKVSSFIRGVTLPVLGAAFTVGGFSPSLPTNSFAEDNRIKVAILDSGRPSDPLFHSMLCHESYDYTRTGLQDDIMHTTAIMLVMKPFFDASRYCVLTVKIFTSRFRTPNSDFHRALTHISNDTSIKYLNLSYEGGVFLFAERLLLGKILQNGVKIYIAAGNKAKNFDRMRCDTYPACYGFKDPNFIVVGSALGRLVHWFSNYGGPVNRYEDGTNVCYKGKCDYGTSFSAPKALAKDLP